MKTLSLDKGPMRLDAAVSLLFAVPREKSKAAIKQGLVTVNGKSVDKPSFSVGEGDEISYEEPASGKPELARQDIPLNIVYEDEDVLVIDKPQGLIVHPGHGHKDVTIVNALLHMGYSLPGDVDRPGIVHRIDKDTSGLLAVAKSKRAFDCLKKQLEDHSMHREYLALVVGEIPEDEAKIDAPLGRDPNNPLRYKVAQNGKEAITYFKVEKRYPGYTLLRCRLLTGRTHQIRVHLEYIGHPVEGDPVYGKGNRKLYEKGQLLHAAKLVFTHPDGRQMEFDSPLPDYFKEVLKSLE